MAISQQKIPFGHQKTGLVILSYATVNRATVNHAIAE